MTNRNERIRDLLSKTFSPEALEVKDESHLHKGHAGARPEGETHFYVEIVASAFQNMNRVERHRALNDVLKPEFETGLHALRLKADAPKT